MSWKAHIEDLARRFGDKVGGSIKVGKWLSFKDRKQLSESSLISMLSYGIELISQGTEKEVARLEGLVISKAARIVLKVGKMNWSKSAGMRTLGWQTFVEMATETSLRTMLKVLENKVPQNLYAALTDENGNIKQYTEAELEKMTKLRRKSWSVRTLRWYQILPADIKRRKAKSESCKKRLREWVHRRMTDNRGDEIFRGKMVKIPVIRRDNYTERQTAEVEIERGSEDEDWIVEFNHQIDSQNRNDNMVGAVGEDFTEEELNWVEREIEELQMENLRHEREQA